MYTLIFSIISVSFIINHSKSSPKMQANATTSPQQQAQPVDPATQAAISNKGHTILLIQFTADETTKTFLEYADISKCVDGVCQLYEQRLRLQNSDKQEVTYDVQQLFAYLDQLTDIGAMVYNVNIKAYEPKSRDWIKQQVYCGLKG